VTAAIAAPARRPWLFSRTTDLAVFGGTALVALALALAWPHRDAPTWTWIGGVLLVDVAHVWSTTFVVYFDRAELRRRPLLYTVTPIAAFAIGLALYLAFGELGFWRAIAYLAVFHFIRQQYGWVMMYRARNGERDRAGRWIDGAMIYAATLYPLVWWHAHLPRQFEWMKAGDFVGGLPAIAATIAGGCYVAIAALYLGAAIARARRGAATSWGKHLIVATTAACWYVGIVATDNDYAFTLTNVFIHGVPYMVLVFVYARAAGREPTSARSLSTRLLAGRRGLAVFVATLWAIAYVEELAWDRGVWHDHAWLFGDGPQLGAAVAVVSAILAVPQLTHYALDAVLWRRASNPRVARLL